jgi:hypothetical protein
MDVAMWVHSALHSLTETGLLLESDPQLPSVTAIVAGGPIRGSWWGNPAARGAYQVLVALEDHPDALRTKLINGTVTYVHRTLWPALLGVALARDASQLRALSHPARWLLEEVNANAELRLDLVTPPAGVLRKALLEAARELERRLLVHATEMHTPSGAHARLLQTWQEWQAAPNHQVVPLSPEDGRALLASRLAHLNETCGAAARLPWQTGQTEPGA